MPSASAPLIKGGSCWAFAFLVVLLLSLPAGSMLATEREASRAMPLGASSLAAARAVPLSPVELAPLPFPTIPATTPFEQNLRRVFDGDMTADIRITFGYDNSPDLRNVNDPFRAAHLIKYLTHAGFTLAVPDEGLRQTLGVTPAAENLRVLEGKGRYGQTLRISLVWSSRTTNFAKNIGSEYTQQLDCSEEARNFMQKAAAESEVMIYVGHSREGGGPDTYPPEMMRGGAESLLRVNFAPYRATRPGLAALGPYFTKPGPGPCFVAWASCLSDRHFSGWFSRMLAQKDHPTSLILSTRTTTYHAWIEEIPENDEGLMAVVNLIEALQYLPSQDAFERRLKTCEIDAERKPGQDAWKLSVTGGPSR